MTCELHLLGPAISLTRASLDPLFSAETFTDQLLPSLAQSSCCPPLTSREHQDIGQLECFHPGAPHGSSLWPTPTCAWSLSPISWLFPRQAQHLGGTGSPPPEQLGALERGPQGSREFSSYKPPFNTKDTFCSGVFLTSPTQRRTHSQISSLGLQPLGKPHRPWSQVAWVLNLAHLSLVSCVI